MTTTPTSSPRIKSIVPSTRVLHAINPFVSLILRSPLHRLLSSDVLLLTFTGRKTGKQYTIPAGYVLEGNTLTIFSSKSWWKNLHAGAPVVVRVQGHERTAHAEVISERTAVRDAANRLIAQRGLKAAGAKIGLALDTTPPPSPIELASAMEHRVVIRLTLDS